jgi:tetratricopeptide (TPR) repeat protein
MSAMGHILITTRSRSLIHDFPPNHALQFGKMPPEEAIDLLLKSANLESVDKQRNAASKLAAELGYLALALELAGAAIRKCYDSLEAYLDTYLGHRQNLLLSSPLLEREEVDAIASWDISFKRMTATGGVDFKDAGLLMSVLVFLHFESISTSIFRAAYLATANNDDELPDLFRLQPNSWKETNIRLRRAFKTLHNYSIVDYDSEKHVCSIHPVIHKWARMRLSNSEDFSHFLACAMTILARCISPHLEASGQDFRRTLLPHIDCCKNILEKRGGALPSDKFTANALEKFAALYAETGNWKAALELQQLVVKYRRSTQGRLNHETLDARRKMSQIEWNRFEIGKAIDGQKDLLLTRWYARRNIGDWIPFWLPDHVEYCVALDDLTQSLWLAKQLQLSKWTGQRALAGLSARLGPHDPLTLNAMLNLARTYHHLGELAEARRMLRHIVKERRRLFGPDHPDTLMARNEMGMVFLARQQIALAETIVHNVYQARKRVLGAEHAYTLWSANDLAKVYFSRRDEAASSGPYIKAPKAVELLEGIIPIVARTLKEDHVGMHMTRGNLARAYARCHRWDKSESLLTDMLGLIDSGHPNYVETMCGLAEVQINLGKLDEADASCKQILRKLESEQTRARPRILGLFSLPAVESNAGIHKAKLMDLMESVKKARGTLQQRIS